MFVLLHSVFHHYSTLQVTTVTSKLDNRWKEPPKKSNRPLRNVSLALNRALDAKVKGQRPSVPWATPGTIAQVMKETGHRSMEDTVFEEDEEDMEEEEEEVESDVADTPVAKKEDTSKVRLPLALPQRLSRKPGNLQ